MNKNIFSFTASDHMTLPWILYSPQEKDTKEIAIYLHGNGSSSVFYSMDKLDTIWKQLVELWISFAPFNNRGAGYHQKIESIDEDWNKCRKSVGTAFELVKDSIVDIDSIVSHFKREWYTKFHLIGESTWSNKICVYNRYKENNVFSSYILAAAWDDTGVFYKYMWIDKFDEYLTLAPKKIEHWHWADFVPREDLFGMLMSYKSLYDTINPDGDYNTFPYNEHIKDLWLSKAALFRYFQKISIPTTVIYGEHDEYCWWGAKVAINILRRYEEPNQSIRYEIIKWANHGFGWYNMELAQQIRKHFVSFKNL